LSGRDHILEHRCASGEEELLEDEAEGAVSGGGVEVLPPVKHGIRSRELDGSAARSIEQG
jgi:hypothetical protein